MFLRISDNKIEIYLNSSEHDAKDILANTQNFILSPEVIEKLKTRCKSIKLGLTLNGTDINSVSPYIIEMMEKRGLHMALVDLYKDTNGSIYRCHMSNREKESMIKEFENEQNELGLLDSLGFTEYIPGDLFIDSIINDLNIA